MDIKAIAFDVNGTLVEIWTDEGFDELYRQLKHFLSYQGITVRTAGLRDAYFRNIKAQQKASNETYPEYNAVQVWRSIIEESASDFSRDLPEQLRSQLPLCLAQMHRALSRKRLQPYPFIREVLDVLRTRFPLAIVTDAQSAFARPELHKTGLLDYFNTVIVSGDVGYRKPDSRLFRLAVDAMHADAAQTLYIGNDMYRDIYGAREAGLKTMMFNSNQGDKEHDGVTPDWTITDYRELLHILELPPLAE